MAVGHVINENHRVVYSEFLTIRQTLKIWSLKSISRVSKKVSWLVPRKLKVILSTYTSKAVYGIITGHETNIFSYDPFTKQ